MIMTDNGIVTVMTWTRGIDLEYRMQGECGDGRPIALVCSGVIVPFHQRREEAGMYRRSGEGTQKASVIKRCSLHSAA
jgi:hypothetical protein